MNIKTMYNRISKDSYAVSPVVAVLILIMVAIIGAAVFPPAGSDECHSPQVWENNAKLMEVSERLVLADLAAKGIPLTGFYVDAWTCTIYVGLTEIKDDYTEPIKAIVNEVDGVNLEFFKAKFTEAELRGMQRKIEDAFREGEALKKDERGIPFLTATGADIKDNELTVGLRALKPQYIEAIRKIVGTEVPIEFTEEVVPLDSTKTDRHRPLIGGIQVTTPAGSSTLGFRATRTDGTVGFVMTGHVGWVGTRVYQPSQWRWPWQPCNWVGIISVNPPGPRNSDAAFVPTTNINSTVWPTRSIVGWRSSSLTPPGTAVRMEGRTSCGTAGVVHRTGQRVWSTPYNAWLWNQVRATYTSAGGDSGSPVFGLDGAGNAIIFGIHWGGAIVVNGVTVRTYSPVEGVRTDLGLRWGS